MYAPMLAGGGGPVGRAGPPEAEGLAAAALPHPRHLLHGAGHLEERKPKVGRCFKIRVLERKPLPFEYDGVGHRKECKLD